MKPRVFLIAVGLLIATQVSASEADFKELATASNRLGCAMYGEMLSRPGNLVTCPLGLYSALGMISAGARGETDKELARLLSATSGLDKIHPAIAAWTADLSARAATSGELAVANRLWPRTGPELQPAFRELLSTSYHAEVQPLDFADPAAALRAINQWAELATRGRIKQALPASALTPATSLVLADAVYFLGKWQRPFDPKMTRDGAFYLSANDTVTVPMMHQDAAFRTATAQAARLVELPYSSGMALILIVPDDLAGLPRLEKALTLDALNRWLAGLKSQGLDLTMPKFKISAQLDLAPALQALGAKTLFSPAADLSAITGKKELFLDTAIQSVFIDVNETGTEAAAVTSLGVAADGNPRLTIDHPFLFLIRDDKSGTILFMGRVVDPRGGGGQ
jgi:serpin B